MNPKCYTIVHPFRSGYSLELLVTYSSTVISNLVHVNLSSTSSIFCLSAYLVSLRSKQGYKSKSWTLRGKPLLPTWTSHSSPDLFTNRKARDTIKFISSPQMSSCNCWCLKVLADQLNPLLVVIGRSE
jgi:hypothetical protein